MNRRTLKTVDDINFKIPGLRIISKIGEGGMSVVYMAEQISLKREVAVKVMRLEIADNDLDVQRFKHEAKTIAQLDHPNIINIYNIGQTSNGEVFFTMPYLNHGDLSSYLIEDEKQFIELLKSVCDGLSFAHDHGVVHRDIKPENLLFDKFGSIRIADFGIAISKEGSRMTKEHQIVGSAQYMSPEQARSQSVDLRTDIYSLGIVIYERLTGRVPFDSDESISILVNHVSSPPPPLPAKMKHWQKLIDKCLAKDPADRFQSMVELKIALDKVPVNTLQRTNDSIQTLLANPLWKNKKVWAASALGFLLIIVIAMLFNGDTQPPEEQEHQNVSSEIKEKQTDLTNTKSNITDENPAQQEIPPVDKQTLAINNDPQTDLVIEDIKTDNTEKGETIESTDNGLVDNQDSSPVKQQIINSEDKKNIPPLAVIKQNLKNQTQPWDSNKSDSGESEKTQKVELTAKEIEELLIKANNNIELYQLTKPADDNAVDQLLQILKASPENMEALDGLALVGTKYYLLINGALQRHEFSTAVTHLQSLQSLNEKSVYEGPDSEKERQTLISIAENLDLSSEDITANQVKILMNFLQLIEPENSYLKTLELVALQKSLPKKGDKLLDSKNIETVLITDQLALTTSEITVQQYSEFVKASGRPASKCKHKGGSIGSFFSSYTWKEPPFTQTRNDPIICVSYEDSVAYSQWLSEQTGNSYRLPTQKEWLMASSLQKQPDENCKSANTAGTEAESIRNRDTNYSCNDGFIYTAPVSTFESNEMGIYDLQGNVSEWVDCGEANCQSPVAMGSSWYNGKQTNKTDTSDKLRDETGYTYVGIRLVRDI